MTAKGDVVGKGGQDVIIVGGGHNGLVCALMLAKRGLAVTVIEEKDTVGGAAKTERPFKKVPELATSTGAYLLGLMPPELMARMGVDIPVPGVSHVPLSPEKPSVTAYIALTRSLLNANRSRYSPTGLRHRSTNARRSGARTYRSAVSSIDSGSWSHVGATSSRICAISAWSAWFARQSASEKNVVNWRFVSSWFDPNIR
jgi:phytoene dehydrogenase-like protein